MSSARAAFWAGVRAELPILLGTMPFGLIYGVLAIKAGLSPAAAQAMSAIVFAGSSQFLALDLFSKQVVAPVIVLTTFVVNLRHALYSASVSPYVKHLSARWKWLLAYLLTDEAYAVAITHYQLEPDDPHGHWYFFGAGITLWSSWQASTAVGILLGAQVPEAWGLDFTLALTFIGLVVPALRDRPAVAAALSAGLVAVLAAELPYRAGLLLAAAVGIGAGLLAEALRDKLKGAKGVSHDR